MVKIKSIPIELQWSRIGDGVGSLEKTNLRRDFRSLPALDRGADPTSQRRWFRSPPKVQVVTGILGRGPSQGTHGGDPDGGEREVAGDHESGHQLSSSPPYPTGPTERNSPFPHSNPSKEGSKSSLARFVGHL